MCRYFILSAFAGLLFCSCGADAPAPVAENTALKGILAAEYAQLKERHEEFFLPPRTLQQQRRKIQFAPLLAASVAFDDNIWRAQLWSQYQIRSSQKIDYYHTTIQGSYEDSLYIINLQPEPQDRHQLHRQLVWDKKGYLIYEGQALDFALITVDTLAPAPYLLVLQPDTRPSHHFLAYSSSSNSLVDKIDNYSDNLPPTFSQPDLGFSYAPEKLKLSVKDIDGDGLQDLVFEGTKLLANKQKEPVSLNFIYRKSKDAFMFAP